MCLPLAPPEGFPGALVVENSPVKAGDLREVSSIPGLGKSHGGGQLATHSSILAWRILWTEEPGRLVIGLQRVGHDWSDLGMREKAGSTLPYITESKQLILIYRWFLFILYWIFGHVWHRRVRSAEVPSFAYTATTAFQHLPQSGSHLAGGKWERASAAVGHKLYHLLCWNVSLTWSPTDSIFSCSLTFKLTFSLDEEEFHRSTL